MTSEAEYCYQEACKEADEENALARAHAQRWREKDAFARLVEPLPRHPPSFESCLETAKRRIGGSFWRRRAVKREAQRLFDERVAKGQRNHQRDIENYRAVNDGNVEAVEQWIGSLASGHRFDCPLYEEELKIVDGTLCLVLGIDEWEGMDEFAYAKKNGDVDYKRWPTKERKPLLLEAITGGLLAYLKVIALDFPQLINLNIMVGTDTKSGAFSPRIHGQIKPSQLQEIDVSTINPVAVLQTLGFEINVVDDALRKVKKPAWLDLLEE